MDAGACVVSVLNGVDHQDRIASVLGAGSVLGGLSMVSGVMVAPGQIRTTSTMSGLRFGEVDGSMSDRATAFRDACLGAGFSADLLPDIRTAQWAKFVRLASNAALTSLFRLPPGHIYHDADTIPMATRPCLGRGHPRARDGLAGAQALLARRTRTGNACMPRNTIELIHRGAAPTGSMF